MTASVPQPGSGARPPAPGGGHRFVALDGYRAIAALTVVAYHVMGRLDIHTDYDRLGSYTSLLGGWAVTVFFLLSGVLLYRPFALAHLTARRPPETARFYARRLLRIIPAYWVALTAALFVFRYRSAHGLGDYLTFYGFAQIYRVGYVLSGLGQAWSLCVEMSFYLLLPLIALGFRHLWWGARPTTPRRILRSQLYGVGALFGAGLLFRWWAVHSSLHYPQATSWLPALLMLFAMGMLLSVASCWREVGGGWPPVVTWLAARPWLCWLLALELFWVLSMLHLPRGFDPETMDQTMWRPLLTGLSAFFFLIPGTLGPNRAEARIPRLLASRPMVALGVISYGIYLWHPLWIQLYLNLGAVGQGAPRFVPMLGVVLLLTVASATASYLLIERPMLRLGERTRRARDAAPVDLRAATSPEERRAPAPAVLAIEPD